MNKVYIVFEDNGQLYDDYDKWVNKVFDMKDQAKKYIKKSKAKEQRLYKKNSYYDKHDFWLEEYTIEN